MAENEEIKGRAKGGIARSEALSPARRKAIAEKAAMTRWSKGIPVATHTGTINIGSWQIECAVLDDGRRVLSQRGLNRALGRSHGGADFRRKQESEAGGEMPVFLGPKNLSPFISSDLMAVVTKPILYRTESAATGHGMEATLLTQVCDVWIAAKEAGKLTKVQEPVAARARVLLRGLADLGIIGLVDEATGYQEVRDKRALQALLDKYLNKELAAWAKRFPDEFYKEMFRLRGWKWPVPSARRPGAVGNYTKDLVYERIAPGILEQLEARNPKDERGNRRGRHHQLLTDDVGHPALAQHLHAVIGLMRASSGWDQFYRMVNRAFPKKGETLELALDD